MEKQVYKPIPPPVTWFGSKSRIVKKITKHFQGHHTFVDVFGGSGAVLLGKPPSKVEVYNDLNRKMASLFQVLSNQRKTKELIKLLEFTPYSRDEFTNCRNSINDVSDDIELARQMIVVQRQSHGGLGKQWSYCVDAPAAGYSASVRKFHAGIDRLSDIAKRVRKVQVENMHWEEVIRRYDRDNTLFYLDPPYIPDTRVDGEYEHEMSIGDHEKMVEALLSIKGMAVLSGYSHDIYLPLEDNGWTRIEIEVTAQTSKNRARRVECLWVSHKRKKTGSNNIKARENSNLTKQQISAYELHDKRTSESERKIIESIKILKRINKKITKAEVSRMTGISRVQISRRYSYLFD